jgi:hypothetical protein
MIARAERDLATGLKGQQLGATVVGRYRKVPHAALLRAVDLGDPRVRSVAVAATWSAHPQASVAGSGGRHGVGLHAEELRGRVERRRRADVRQVAGRVDRAVGPRQGRSSTPSVLPWWSRPCCRSQSLVISPHSPGSTGCGVTSCPVQQTYRWASPHGWRRVCTVVCPRR